MLRTVRLASLIAAILLVGATTLDAQRPRRGLVELPPPGTRHGVWLGGGLGAGAEAWRFDQEDWTEDLRKPTFSFRVGGTPDEHLRLGGELTTWVNPYTDLSGFDVTESLTSLTLIGQFYPIRTSGLFLKGGAGVGFSAVTVEGGDNTTETGFVVQYGAGYDIRLGRKLFLTPTVEFFRHQFTQRDEPTLHERLFNIGIAITYQPN